MLQSSQSTLNFAPGTYDEQLSLAFRKLESAYGVLGEGIYGIRLPINLIEAINASEDTEVIAELWRNFLLSQTKNLTEKRVDTVLG